MASTLILQDQLASVGNKRQYEKFLNLITSKAQLGDPVQSILPNAEALDAFKIPVGNVLKVAASSPLVSELVTRTPFEAVAVFELPAGDYSEGTLKAKLQTFFDEKMVVADSLPAFSLTQLDADHWEASIKNATISVMRVKGRSNWSGHAFKSQPSNTSSEMSSFLEASMKHDVPNYSYALVVSSAVENEIMQEYVNTLSKACQTAGEVARHPLTRGLQSYIMRNTNRLMLSVAEHMGWDIPVQVDSGSVYNTRRNIDYAAPLMARPDHIQLNNGLVAEGDVVHVFNGAIQLAQQDLHYTMVNLGYEYGMAMFRLAPEIQSSAVAAMPTSVQRLAIDAYPGSKLATAVSIGNVKSIIGKDMDSVQFKKGYYQTVSDAFLTSCQKLAGQADVSLTINSPAAPMIFAPVVTVVGPQVGVIV